ncbi:hypothetical protein M758_3G053000 [Ceratodon purpureus]|uniref:Uncharacterized protein n=1 Tax=Ceratodon purpureus TaxID=3225 RepID=A0A8T0IF86_CERPU|nr:hypothetical protein KC19_3G055000 [Ceratodon purpureus]KAG0621856.1 hypothetical protein M758_3G053000 [Ceratodon purpureus]
MVIRAAIKAGVDDLELEMLPLSRYPRMGVVRFRCGIGVHKPCLGLAAERQSSKLQFQSSRNFAPDRCRCLLRLPQRLPGRDLRFGVSF